jgi:hypothetical protein
MRLRRIRRNSGQGCPQWQARSLRSPFSKKSAAGFPAALLEKVNFDLRHFAAAEQGEACQQPGAQKRVGGGFGDG